MLRYVYRITIMATQCGHNRRHRIRWRWSVNVHWSHGVVTDYGTYRSLWLARAVAEALGRDRLRVQGDNKRLEIVIDRRGGNITTKTLARDPRSLA